MIHTLIAGIQTYFDRALGSILLYRFERAQYADIRKEFVTGQHVKPGDNRTMSSIYGAEHLARLLVKLPEMVAHTTMDDASVALLREYVTELMRYVRARPSHPRDWDAHSFRFALLPRCIAGCALVKPIYSYQNTNTLHLLTQT